MSSSNIKVKIVGTAPSPSPNTNTPNNTTGGYGQPIPSVTGSNPINNSTNSNTGTLSNTTSTGAQLNTNNQLSDKISASQMENWPKDPSMKENHIIGYIGPNANQNKGVKVKWRYIQGFGVRLLKLGLFNQSNNDMNVEFVVSVYQDNQVIKTWTVKETIQAGKKITNWDTNSLEKNLEHWVNRIKLIDIKYSIL